ncbi:hypothetical protein BUZ14_04225 [Staphylococcus gallinarum]|uniref:Uncharacterized protein n=1 Tax=Staphylococcus gallinarum TaxID=1293 RepID=A0A3A0W1P4_STAGA|nr:hypothetical protein [Staphylococcus gallinarum]RIP35865.1 hypothetical protein BUZ14_04225 [Staphylococcus gallinarum]
MFDVIFLSIIFTFIIIVFLLIIDFIGSKKIKNTSNFGLKHMFLKVICNRKSFIIYTSIMCFSFFTLLLSWGLMKIMTFNFYYSFWLIVFITFISFVIMQNYLILISAKTFYCSHKVEFGELDDYKANIIFYECDENKVLEKFSLIELITYLKVFYEGISLILTLYVVGLSISDKIDEGFVKALNLSYGLCVFIPLFSLKLHEQRFKFLKEKFEGS